MAPARAIPNLTPQQVVLKVDKDILRTIREMAEVEDYETRRKSLTPILSEVFDLDRITITSIGRAHWQKWTAEERRIYKRMIVHYLTAVYLDRFSAYKGSGLTVTHSEEEGKRALVHTRLILQDKDMVDISFALHKGKKGWKITDVYFQSAISEVANLRAQFSRVLRKKGWRGLIDEMEKLTLRLMSHEKAKDDKDSRKQERAGRHMARAKNAVFFQPFCA